MGNNFGANINGDKHKQLTIKQLMQIIQQRYQQRKRNQYSHLHIENNQQNKSSIYKITNKFKQYKISDQEDRTYGCLFGCLIGDALGSYCQFQTKQIDQQTLKKAMSMSGGGVFNLRSGQFTDDSEMSYHLLKGLLNINVFEDLKTQQNKLLINIAEQYVKWIQSAPFDIGNTCRSGIAIIKMKLQTQKIQKIQNILSQVYKTNSKSQSNGSLMRITPMALFFHLINQQPQNYKNFIKSQIRLLHPNPVLTQAGYIWVVVLYSLIRRKDNLQLTFKKIYQHAEKINENQEIKSWFIQSKQSHKMAAITNMGWAKIAWTYGMNILYRLSTIKLQESHVQFLSEIKSVIKQAGDSDTNACIVGGIIGAVVGFNKLPKNYLQKLMKLQFPSSSLQKRENDRPKQYQPFNVFVTLIDFMQKSLKYKQNRKKSQ